jgi:hypothetical protein
MLKDLLASLKNNQNGYSSNYLKSLGFDYLIENSTVYLLYSIKIEVDKNEFKDYIKDYLNDVKVLQNNNDFYNNIIETCYKWYCYFLENKSLVKSTSSLKSDTKKLYKKYIGNINGFDRFFEKIYNAFQEAYNVYDIVFYNATAIINNNNFSSDRKSCFLTDRKDNLQAIKHANTYYVMIYQDKTPVTRVWVLCDKDFEHIAIFNMYGFQFRHLEKLFSNPNKNELQYGDYGQLRKWTGVHVNNDIVLVNTNNYDCFVYDLYCPYCYSPISSDQLFLKYIENNYGEEKGHMLMCIYCGDIVYSTIYQEYIDLDEAEYSDYYETYIYFDEAVNSRYLADYIYLFKAMKVWNIDINDWDWVPEEMAVISNMKDDKGNPIYLIKDQAIYSDYYKAYIPKDENAVYSKHVKSYIDKRDKNFVKIGNDYVLKDSSSLKV